jgi:hypothetical protein
VPVPLTAAVTPHAQAQEAAQTVLAYIVDNASTNGTFVNGARLAAHVPVPLRHDDLVTFASADAAGPKCVAFRFQRYDPAQSAQGGAPRGVATGAGETSPQAGVKRARVEGGADPAHALALHAENQALRDKASALQEALAQATAKATAEAAAAATAVAALQEALNTSQATAKRQEEEAAQAASEAAQVAKASLVEAQAAAQADQARAHAASHAAEQAEAAAAEARDERDGVLARLRECQAALDAARAELRAHINSSVSVAADQASSDAVLTAARAEKEAALRRADHATADAQATQQALAAEKAKRAAAEAAAAGAVEQVAALEARLARLQDEARGEREGTDLKHSLQVDLAAAILAAAATLNAALPHAQALLAADGQAAPAALAGRGESQRGSGMGLGLPTQRVPLSAPPPPGFGGPMRATDTQLVEQQTTGAGGDALMLPAEQHFEPAGDDAAMVHAEDEHVQAEEGAEAGLPRMSDAGELVALSPGMAAAYEAAAHGPGDGAGAFDDENGDPTPVPTFPSSSLQAKMEQQAAAAMATAMGDTGRRNSGPGWDAF